MMTDEEWVTGVSDCNLTCDLCKICRLSMKQILPLNHRSQKSAGVGIAHAHRSKRSKPYLQQRQEAIAPKIKPKS